MLGFIRSWGDSVKLFWPQSLKEWGLFTLMGSLRTYTVLIKSFGWLLFLLLVGGGFTVYSLWYQVFEPQDFTILFLTLFVAIVWCLCSFLAARPSVELKNGSYFANYIYHGLVALGVATVMGFLQALLSFVLFLVIVNISDHLYPDSYFKLHSFLMLFKIGFVTQTLVLAPLLLGLMYIVSTTAFGMRVVSFYTWFVLAEVQLIYALLSIPILFILYFMLDSHLSVQSVLKSMWNGIKLAWYTYPVCVLLCVLFQFIVYYTEVEQFLSGIPLLVGSLLFPVYLNIFLYMYIKQIHEHPERYD